MMMRKPDASIQMMQIPTAMSKTHDMAVSQYAIQHANTPADGLHVSVVLPSNGSMSLIDTRENALACTVTVASGNTSNAVPTRLINPEMIGVCFNIFITVL